MSKQIATNAGVGFNAAQLRKMAVNIRQAERLQTEPVWDGTFQHERIVAANASLINQAFFSEKVTNFATNWTGNGAVEAELEFVAPMVPVPRRFEYAAGINAEAFLSDLLDDERPIRGNFKAVEYNSEKVQAKTANRGLMICVDLDEVAEKDGWENRYAEMLLRRLRLSSLRRAVSLLSAASTNTAKTWDVTAGKDPDQDVNAELIVASDISGMRKNKVFYGETASSKRILSHRAQNTAGGFASAAMSDQQLAGLLGVEGVMTSRARYQSTASAKSQVVGNLVLMFDSQSGISTDDSSDIKRFVSPVEGGGYVRVYVQQVNAKLVTITVEHYELLKLTNILGLRKFTVS